MVHHLGMSVTPGSGNADVLLSAAYPSVRQRANAVRWLGWLAFQMGDREWGNPNLVPSGVPGLLRLWAWPPAALLAAVPLVLSAVILWVACFYIGPLVLVVLFFVNIEWIVGLCNLVRQTPRLLKEALLSLLLRNAVIAGVLVKDHGSYSYAFADPVLRSSLAARHRADRDASERLWGDRIARKDPRARLLKSLNDRLINRIRIDICAAGVVMGVMSLALGWASPGRLPLIATALVLPGTFILYGLFCPRPMVRFTRWTLLNLDGISRTDIAVLAMLAVAVLVPLVFVAGPVLTFLLPAIVPALFVGMCGLWGFHLLSQEMDRRPMLRRRLRYLPDTVVAVTVGAAGSVFMHPSSLTNAWVTPLLFPIMFWGSFRAWRAMNASERPTVKAAADLTLSLLLGTEIVVILVWLANRLGMPRAEVSMLRDAFGRVGAFADIVPAWGWVAVYLALAMAGPAAGRWPRRLRKITNRVPVVLFVNIPKRVLTGVHVAFLVIVLVAVAAPPAITPLLRNQVKARYTVALQRELAASEKLATATWIRNGLRPTAEQKSALSEMVLTIHAIGHQASGNEVSLTEADLARRVGLLQASELRLQAPAETPKPAGENTANTIDKERLREGIFSLDTQEREESTTQSRSERIWDNLAAAISSSISIPGIGNNEVLQIAREYLGGLLEESQLVKKIFVYLSEYSAGSRLPSADQIVVPDGTQLETAASAELRQADSQEASQGNDGVVIDANLLRVHSLMADAVYNVNAIRYLQQDTGPCDCAQIQPGGTGPVLPGFPQPGEPGPDNPGDHGDGGDSGHVGGGE